ncbi:hypothetical protein ONZ45_g10272 [Pleurotus djamor]|nr:hypothetical protein ONZ45_g10272 [Pleurotus djamor]
MTSNSERTPSPQPLEVHKLTSTPENQAKPELPTRTPAVHRAAGVKPLSSNLPLAQENQDIMADETQGYWIGPCPLEEFTTEFMEPTGTEERPHVSTKFFAEKDIGQEQDLYTAFVSYPSAQHLFPYGLIIDLQGEFVNDTEVAPGFELVDTSSHHDPNSRPGSQIKPDSNLYKKGDVKVGHRNQMDKASMVAEFKYGEDCDILVFDKLSRHSDDAPFEATADERRRNRGQLVSYLVEMAARQHRTHIFVLFVFHPYARLVRWDRSAIVVSQRFNYVEDCSPLADFFWRYSQLDDAQRGYDQTVVLANKAEARHAKRYLQPWAPPRALTRDVYKIEVPCEGSAPRSFLVWGALAEPASPLGRGTKGWPAVEVTMGPEGPEFSTKPVFLKEQWRGKDVTPEAETLKLLNKEKVDFVPTYVCGGDLGGDFQTTISHEYAEATWRNVSDNKAKVKKIEIRIHVRVVTEEVGTPLEEFKSSRQMFSAIYDALRGHKDAYIKCGLLHRDISGGNILILENGKGLLNDWDLAIKIDEIKNARTAERTGTWPFMSIALLGDPTKLHTVRDDLESFIWVVLFYGLHYLESTESKDPLELQTKVLNIFHEYTTKSGKATGGAYKLLACHGSYIVLGPGLPNEFKFTRSSPLTTFIYDSLDRLVTWVEDSRRAVRRKGHDADELWLADPLALRHDHIEDLFATALKSKEWPLDDAASLQLPTPRSAGHRISTKKRKTDDEQGSSKRAKKSSQFLINALRGSSQLAE